MPLNTFESWSREAIVKSYQLRKQPSIWLKTGSKPRQPGSQGDINMTEANEKVKSAEYTSTPDPPVRSSSDLLECLKYHEDAAAECAQDIIDMGVQDDADDDIGLGGALRHNEFMHNRYAAAIRVAEAKLKDMQCCGNCIKKYSCGVFADNSCLNWKSDNLTEEERK